MLDGSNKYACEVCHVKPEAEWRFYLSKLPRVLTIHLNLLQFTELRAAAKIPVASDCPFRTSFDDWTTAKCAKTAPVHQLTAIIVHHGGYSTSGHYYAFIHKQELAQWYKFDDSIVTTTTEESIEKLLLFSPKTKKAYLLFYSASE